MATKTYKLTDDHPFMQKVIEANALIEDMGISFYFGVSGTVIAEDTNTGNKYRLSDVDNTIESSGFSCYPLGTRRMRITIFTTRHFATW